MLLSLVGHFLYSVVSSRKIESAMLLPAATAASASTGIKSVTASSAPLTAKLTEQNGLFTVRYPRTLFARKADETIVSLGGGEKAKGQKLSYRSPDHVCNAPSSASPCGSVASLSVGFYVVEKDFNRLHQDWEKEFSGHLKVVTIDGHQGIMTKSEQATGEKHYYLVPIDDSRTLLLVRTSSSASFLSPSRQESLFNEILTTFSFRQ